jgi:hypothetical protein
MPGRQRSGGWWFQANPREIVWKILSEKYPTLKKAERVA